MANHRKYYNKKFVCEQCGEPFERLDNREYRFCSPKCRAIKINISDPEKHSIFICGWCGKFFEGWTYRKSKFCSNQCRSEFAARQPKNKPFGYEHGGKTTWRCLQCGKEKRTFKSRKRTFCSPKCWGKSILGKSRFGYGTAIKNLSYRGENWQSQREKTRKRDKYKCRVCGIVALDVHHIIKYKLFNGNWEKANELDNLIVLCEAHHNQVEHNSIACPKP